MNQRPRRGSLAARESRLAWTMLTPALLIVAAMVILPVLADFWISFKTVSLSDLRAPVPVVRERVLQRAEAAGDTLSVRYQMRNSSQSVTLTSVVLSDQLPEGLTLLETTEPCSVAGDTLSCQLGDWPGGHNLNVDLDFAVDSAYLAADTGVLQTAAAATASAPNVLTNLTFTLDNYRRYLTGSEFWPTLRTTIWYTIFGTGGSLILGLFAAQLLNVRFRGQGFLRGLYLFPYVAPVIAVAFTWAFLLDPLSGSVNALGRQFGLWDNPINFLGQRHFDLDLFGFTLRVPLALSMVILFEAWRYFPFAFLFILARFQSIPRDMYEAADVDGAGIWQQFRFITLPHLTTILSTLFLLRFIWTFNKFDDIFLLTGGASGTKTLTVSVYDEAFARQDLGSGAAVSVVLFIILALFMVIYFRYAPEGE